MSNPLPPLTWFRAFEASARHLSFTLAANELNVTQSAISQHVRSLELKFGKALFERKPRGLALTQSGRLLLPHASSAIDGLAKATELFLNDTGVQEVSVSCTTSFAQLWLSPRLKQFQKKYPHIVIKLMSTLWPDDYLLRKTDIEVRFGRTSQLNKQSKILLQIDFAPMCNPDLFHGFTNIEAVWKLPLIETVGAMYGWKLWANRSGYSTPPEAVCTVDSMIMAQSLSEAGVGVALLSPFLCSASLEARQLNILTKNNPPSEDCYYFNVSEHSAAKPSVKAFSDWLAEEAVSS